MQYECAAYVIDTWIDTVAQGRSNIAPLKMPWELIRTLIVETYGGKVDDEGDFQQLRQLVDNILVPEAYEDDHKLIKGVEGAKNELTVPTGITMKGFIEWVDVLPEREPPTYLGLPANAEKLLLVSHGKRMIENLVKITEILAEGEHLFAGEGR